MIPILLLIVLMMGFKVSGYKSAIATLAVTIVLALFAVPSMGIVPEKYAGASIYGIALWSVFEGLLKACFPIILIIIFAILRRCSCPRALAVAALPATAASPSPNSTATVCASSAHRLRPTTLRWATPIAAPAK